jgi:hypothetical protein
VRSRAKKLQHIKEYGTLFHKTWTKTQNLIFQPNAFACGSTRRRKETKI